MPILTPEEYRQRASQIYDPSYAIKVANANNSYNNVLNQYNSQAGVIDNNFNSSVQQIQQNTALTQNQYASNNLSRGLARSTIASTGIASIANQGTALQAEASQQRSQQLNDLENLKSTLRSNLESTLNGLSGERESGINSLAMQLQQRDEDVQMRLDEQAEAKRQYEQNFAFQQQQATLEQAWREKQFTYQQEQDKIQQQIEMARTTEEQRRYEQQLADSKAAAEEDRRRYEEQMALEKQKFQFSVSQASKTSSGGSRSSGSGSSTTVKTVYNNALADVKYLLESRGEAAAYVSQKTAEWLQQGLTSAQIKSIKDMVDNYMYTYQENRQYTSAKPMTYGL